MSVHSAQSSHRLAPTPLYPQASRRTLANAAVIEGFFAFAWMAWAESGTPPVLSVILIVGAILAVLVAGAGLVAVRRVRTDPAPLTGPAAGKRFGLVVAVEIVAIGLGAAVLGTTGHGGFIPVWACFVVGVHFVPLSRVFPGIGLVGLAVPITLAALVALVVGLTAPLPPSVIAQFGAGGSLLAHAVTALVAIAGGERSARPGD